VEEFSCNCVVVLMFPELSFLGSAYLCKINANLERIICYNGIIIIFMDVVMHWGY